MRQYNPVFISQINLSTSHHFFYGFKCLVQIVFFIIFHTTPAKAIYQIRWKSTFENISSYTHHCSCVQLCVYRCFRVVSHYQSAKLKPCIYEFFPFIIPKFHIGVIIFQIGRIGICSKVTPLTDNRISHKTIMPFIRISKDNNIIHLAAYF